MGYFSEKSIDIDELLEDYFDEAPDDYLNDGNLENEVVGETHEIIDDPLWLID